MKKKTENPVLTSSFFFYSRNQPVALDFKNKEWVNVSDSNRTLEFNVQSRLLHYRCWATIQFLKILTECCIYNIYIFARAYLLRNNDNYSASII